MPVFRQSFPLLLTSFINKCGTIGLNLLPILLVEKGFSSTNSSVIMTLVKVALVVGTYLGGWASDRLGMKPSLILSFLFAGIGLGFLPFGSTLSWICGWAILGQLGQALFYSPARLLIVEMVPAQNQQESMGWLRTANSLGLILSFSIGTMIAKWGVKVPMLFDSFTSLAAAAVGLRILPSLSGGGKGRPVSERRDPLEEGKGSSWSVFILCTLTVAGFCFLYDLFMVSTSAKCRLLFGPDGLRVFSQVMVLNTVLCTIFAVFAARALRNPSIVFPVGIVLVAGGTALVTSGLTTKAIIFVGVFIISVGEIIFTSLAQFVLIRTTPATEDQGSLYGLSLVVQSMGRILGAALAFPFVVYNEHPVPFILLSASLVLLLSFLARPGATARMIGDPMLED